MPILHRALNVLKHIRHWSLIDIAYCSFRSPLSGCSLLLGGTFKSSRQVAKSMYSRNIGDSVDWVDLLALRLGSDNGEQFTVKEVC